MSNLDIESRTRPAVAVICNSFAPYRTRLHQRLVREVPEVDLWTVCTSDPGEDKRWGSAVPPEIRPLVLNATYPARGGLLRRWIAEWRNGGRIIDWIRQQDIRAIIVYGYNDPARLRIIRWCGRHAVPCFMSADSNILLDHVRGIKRFLKAAYVRRVTGWCSGIMPFGSRGAEYYMKYGVPPQRIFEFCLEPSYELIQTVSPDLIAGVKSRFSLLQGRRRIMFCGRLVGLKRVDLLIRAFSKLAGARPQWDLVIVGDGPCRAEWEAMVDPSLKDRVIWTGMITDEATIAALYRSCDVLALISDFEQWGLVVNEAAAAGLAIVCSHIIGAAADLVKEGRNGRTFPSGNWEALADRLLDITHPDHIDRMKAASLEILADWRREKDPVESFRRALKSVHVL